MTDLPCDTELATGEEQAPAQGRVCQELLDRWTAEADAVEAALQAPPPPPVQAPELLGRAARHMHDRASTYDAPGGERSMGKTVTAFNAITGHTLSESEGWLLLQVLKDVRSFTRSAVHWDSLEDCIAYAALKAEARGDGR